MGTHNKGIQPLLIVQQSVKTYVGFYLPELELHNNGYPK